jgi:tetratricopeptide (TPR) repeat protein
MIRRYGIAVLAATLFLAMLHPPPARAEVVTIAKSYTYAAGPFESRESSRVVALARAKLLVFSAVAARAGAPEEEAVLAPGVVGVREGAHGWDGSEFRAEVFASLEPGAAASRLEDLAADSLRAQDLRDLGGRRTEALGAIEKLKKEGGPGEGGRYEKLVRELVAVDAAERGYAALAAGSYPAAEKHFAKAIGTTPRDAAAYYNRGVARWLLEDYHRAFGDFRRALEIRPGYERAERSLAQAREFFNRLEATVRYYDRAIAISPAEVDLYYERGLAHWELGNYEEAVRDFTLIVKLSPGVEDGFVNRGGVRLSMEEYHAAIKDLEAAIKINPRSAPAHFNLGLVYLRLGMVENAIESFGRVVEIDPSDSEALFNRGALHEEKGQRARALADMREAARLGHRGAREFLVSRGIEPPAGKPSKNAKGPGGTGTRMETPPAEKPPASGPAPEGEVESTGPRGTEEAFTVQAGAFSDRENAGEFARKLKERGYPSFVQASSLGQRGEVFFVVVGRYSLRSEAEETVVRLVAEDVNAFVKPLE